MNKQNIKDEREVFDNLIKKCLGEEPISGCFYELIGLTKVPERRKTKLLDVGCGRGFHSLNLAKLGFQITGIDVSSQTIKFVNKKCKEEKIKARFLLKNAAKTGFPSENFDVVLFIGTLHHFYYSGLKGVLNEAKRILKKGGSLILVEPNHLYLYNYLTYLAAHFFKKYKKPIYIRYIDEMFTVNERSLNPYDLLSFLKRDFKLVSLKFFPYTLFLSQKTKFEISGLLKKMRKIFNAGSSLLPEKFKYDYFCLKLRKR